MAEPFDWDAEPAHVGDGNDLLAGLRNGAWLDQQVFPPLMYAIPGIVPEGFGLLVGAPKIGKSWLVLLFALRLALGEKVLGCIPVGEARPVLYLALEDGNRRMQNRCRRLLGDQPIPSMFQYMTQVTPGNVLLTLAAWLAIYGDRRPLVILDTLGKVMPPAAQGETTYSRDYRIGSALKALADAHPGCSLLVNHHDRKAASDDFVETVSGTNGLAGAADTIIVLTRPRGDKTGVLRVTGRDVAEGEYAVTFDDAAWCLDGVDLDDAARNAASRKVVESLGEDSASVVACVGKHPEGVRAAEVAAETGLTEGLAKDYLGRLFRANRIDRPTRGLYTPLPLPLSQASQLSHPDTGQCDTGDGCDTVRQEDCPS